MFLCFIIYIQSTKSINDYIPKRTEASEKQLQKKAVHATDEYKEKIKEIVNQLVAEYKQTIKLEASLPNDSNGMLQTQSQQGQTVR